MGYRPARLGFTGRDDLTAYEVKVLRLIVEGLWTKDIAVELHKSEDTVKTQVKSIFRKLGVTNRTQAAVKAIRENLYDIH